MKTMRKEYAMARRSVKHGHTDYPGRSDSVSRSIFDHWNASGQLGTQIMSQVSEAAQPARKLTMDCIMGMNAYLEISGGADWKQHKRVIAGKNMSDPESLDFLNATS